MKKILALLSLVLFIGWGVTAESPFKYYKGEICNGGTDYKIVPIDRTFETGLLIRLNIFNSPADSLVDTTKIMMATRVKPPDPAGMQLPLTEGYQAWEAFTDSVLAATAGTVTVELWFPKDSIITGYDGMLLGDQLRFTFTTTDSVTGTWCGDHSTSLKYTIAMGYF